LSDGFSIQDVNKDIDDLVKYVISNADNLGIDKNKIAIWSFSGGVPFGMYTGLSGFFDYIKCIISYYGFGDFNSVGQFFSINLDAEIMEKFSLSTLVQKNASLVPPLLIARAGLDNKLLNESIDKFIIEALQNNVSIDVLNHSAGQHAFDLFNNNDRTYEIINKSLDFLKLHLK
jgi:dienelactone hydrolase